MHADPYVLECVLREWRLRAPRLRPQETCADGGADGSADGSTDTDGGSSAHEQPGKSDAAEHAEQFLQRDCIVLSFSQDAPFFANSDAQAPQVSPRAPSALQGPLQRAGPSGGSHEGHEISPV
jgi:hypothetical protein